MPDFVRPELGVPSTSYANGSVVSPPPTTVTTVTAPTSIGSPRKPPSWAIGGLPPNGGTPNGGTPMSNGSTPVVQRRPTLSNEIEIASNSPSRVSVILPKEMPERARSPRPRIQPSWVKEKVMSSMSVDDEERAGSSSDGEGFAQAGVPRRPAKQNHNSTSRREANLARFALHAARISDSEDDSSPESRGSTRSTSPRRSLATPCSCDAVASNDAAHDDARSIDSGVVQSDHSNPQAGGHLTLSSSSLTPFTNGHVPNGDVAGISLVTPPPATQQNRMSAENLSRHSRTNSPALSMEHRASNASSVSSGTRRIASAEPPAVVEYRMDPNTVIRNDSPLASFMSSTDEESKIRARRRPGVTRIDSLPLRAASSEDASSTIPRTMSGNGALCTGTTGTTVTATPTSARRQESVVEEPQTMDAEEETPRSPCEPGVSESKTKSSFIFSCFKALHVADRDLYGTLGSIQFNVTYFQNEKKLVINLLKAKNLKAMDSNGFSDPYVKLHLIPGNAKATKLTSRTIEKTLNPVWNEEMVYYGITEEDKAKKTLRVTVLDRDRIGSDFLGETRIALRKLPNNELKKYNLYLENAIPVPAQKKEEEGAERGKIHVGIQYNIQQGSLFVHINRCVELVGMDSTGFSDPYCKISLTPVTSKSHRQRTSIKKRTLNPDFSETIQFVVPFKDLPKKTLQIGVYDHDLGKHDDYIGGILLSTSAKDERGKQWIGCIENPGTLMEGWHKLELDT